LAGLCGSGEEADDGSDDDEVQEHLDGPAARVAWRMLTGQ